MKTRRFSIVLLSALLGACAAPAEQDAVAPAPQTTAAAPASVDPQGGGLHVSATTSVMADLVRQAGGDRVQVTSLLPLGASPHTFDPTPQTIRELSGAQALFSNGAGLEGWLGSLSGAASEVPTYALTEGLALHVAEEEGDQPHSDHSDHDHGEYDPHAWLDPQLAAGYVDRAAAVLAELDPAGEGIYRANAAAYREQLAELEAYGQQRFEALPAEARRVVTDHHALGYFAERFGLEVVGAVIPGLSTEQQPSAQELAALAGQMREQGVRVILSENPPGDRLSAALAEEAGAVVAPPIYVGALGAPGSGSDTYLGAMRYNIDTIADALTTARKPQP